MRILHCIPAMGGGGAERQLTYLAAEQAKQGDSVHAALIYGGPNLDRLRVTGANVHFIRCAGNHDPMILARLVRLIRRLQPDVVQTWLTQMDVLAGVAASLCHVPSVLSERNSELAYPRTLKNRMRDLVGSYAADAVVCNSSCGVDYWRRRIDNHRSLHNIPNALPIRDIEEMPRASDREIGLAPDEKLVLFVGRLAPQKNLETLIPALAIAANRATFTAIFCGEGDETGIRRLIAANRLESRVRLVGYVVRAWGWMKRADAFVSVSKFEGRPNTVLEAAGCGAPLIVSDIPPHRETLDEGAALFVDPDDPEAIADAVVRTLAADPQREARSRRARDLVSELSIAEIARMYRGVYDSIVYRRESRV